MAVTYGWGILLIGVLCPLLGALPLIEGIVYGLTGQRLSRVGTGNISVSAAFYHGGRTAGLLAVLSEASKGLAAVALARYLFPTEPAWEIVALIALVMGRYLGGRGAGTTNVVWGYIAHDWVAASLIFLIGGISFTILRERQAGKLGVLILLPLITLLRHPQDGERIVATMLLSALLALIYSRIPDDLMLSTHTVQDDSKRLFRFFRGDRALATLDQRLSSDQVGGKAATLAYLRQQGYPVPMGWVLPPGDDPAPLIEALHPSAEEPLVVRSSAIGEDSDMASAAGLYESILHVTSQAVLEQAILRCQMSYNAPTAVQYRRDFPSQQGGMAVLVQPQIQGVFSGVAFSRDPIQRQGDAVIIEALPGEASRVVSGRVTPDQYRVWMGESDLERSPQSDTWRLPETVTLTLEGSGDIPPRLLQQVAYLVRQIEALYHGVPQDVEWSYDGQQLWILQARPITTLLPIWTRKIAAEVIPGFIHPLTWSINRPLTCGVWGEIFSLVLGQRSRGLDFTETATLHHSAAYFNATLLGQIFLRMGLPPESLEFLTRGASFSKPPLGSTLRNLPGLLKLIQRDFSLERDFDQVERQWLAPGLAALAQQPVQSLDAPALLSRIEQLLVLLQRVTYFSIFAPLSLAVRQGLFKVSDTDLDNGETPEVASLRSLQSLAISARLALPDDVAAPTESSTRLNQLAATPQGQAILAELDRLVERYGYLSEVATDIAVPTWREQPALVYEMFAQLLQQPLTAGEPRRRSPNRNVRRVQRRLDLKGRVTEVYSRLLAELRWSFLALEQRWLNAGLLTTPGDIFFLEYDEIRQLIAESDPVVQTQVLQRIVHRRVTLERDRQQTTIPSLVYGNDPPMVRAPSMATTQPSTGQLKGIGASPGYIEGTVRVLHTLDPSLDITRDTILVVPYTDSGWALLLARAGGLIAETGGRLSHGAIVAREYGIPAVMDVANATQRFRNGQRVRLDGASGVVEWL